MLLLIELFIDILCGFGDSLGGIHWLFMRRYFIPIILGIGASIITHVWWVGFMVLPTIGTLSLGYFSGENWGRGLWLFLQAVVIGLGLFLTGHIFWFFYLPYIIIAGFLGGIYKNWYQPIGDLITGCWLGSIIFLLH